MCDVYPVADNRSRFWINFDTPSGKKKIENSISLLSFGFTTCKDQITFYPLTSVLNKEVAFALFFQHTFSEYIELF